MKAKILSPKLETERLILRRYKESDIDSIYEIITEERMWNLGKDKHQEFKAQMYKQSEEIKKIWTQY